MYVYSRSIHSLTHFLTLSVSLIQSLISFTFTDSYAQFFTLPDSFDTLTHSLTQIVTQSLTPSDPHSLTPSLTQTLTHSRPHLFPQTLSLSLTHTIYSLTDSFDTLNH